MNFATSKGVSQAYIYLDAEQSTRDSSSITIKFLWKEAAVSCLFSHAMLRYESVVI